MKVLGPATIHSEASYVASATPLTPKRRRRHSIPLPRVGLLPRLRSSDVECR